MDRQSRRQFLRGSLALAGLGLFAGCGTPSAAPQRPPKLPRIGVLASGNAAVTAARLEPFRRGLRELGYAEGRNIIVEDRSDDSGNTGGTSDALRELGAELIRLPVDMIVMLTGNPSVRVLKGLTATIPIVMGGGGVDPVAAGLVESLARPGGNITGLTAITAELSGKRLELLRETVPGLSRVAALWNKAVPDKGIELREVQVVAEALGMRLHSLELGGPEDVGAAFEAAAVGRAEALMVLRDGLTNAQRPRIIELASRARLPAMYEDTEWTAAGGLMAYGANRAEMYRRAATFVDKILKGANPADLPIERPTKFDFVINLQTAQALGLSIPPSVLAQATELIQ